MSDILDGYGRMEGKAEGNDPKESDINNLSSEDTQGLIYGTGSRRLHNVWLAPLEIAHDACNND